MTDLHPYAAENPLLFDYATGAPRSPHWPVVRQRWLQEHPFCAACGASEQLAVHHKKPFHKYPSLELEETNFITLCESTSRPCHFAHGHFYLWGGWNPSVDEDAAKFKQGVEESKRLACG